jgi:hypothetical protein
VSCRALELSESWFYKWRFVQKTIGRNVDDVTLVELITDAARQVGRSPREVDAGIWESGRGDPGAI